MVPERSPLDPVEANESVTLTWGDAASWQGGISVAGSGGALDFEVEALEAGVRLHPLPRWPDGDRVRVDLDAALVDGEGRTLSVAEVAFTVATLPSESTEVVVRRPVPGGIAPANLAWLVLAGTQPEDAFALVGASGERVALRPDPDHEGHFVLSPPLSCAPPCRPDVLRLEGPRLSEVERLVTIFTSSAADMRFPEVELEALVEPGRVEVEIRATEWVRASGRWSGGGRQGHFDALELPGLRQRLRAMGEIPFGGLVELEIEAEDLGGMRTRARASVRLPESIFAEVTEVVAAPRRDWGDSTPAGVPFDPHPGAGTVSAADEWIELVNRGDDPVDLSAAALELRVLDGTPSSVRVVDAAGAYFGDGGSWRHWSPGEALVVRPRGDTAQSDVTIELWAGAVPLDRVVLGALRGADHPGGAPPDVIHESLAQGADGVFRWCRPTPGDPSPPDDCWRD